MRPALPSIAPLGSRVTWTQDGRSRNGTVIDRAPNDVDPQVSFTDGAHRLVEIGGFWVWVLPDQRWPDDEGCMVRLRCYDRGRNAGTIERAPLVRLNGERYRSSVDLQAFAAYRRRNQLDYIEEAG